MTEPRIDPELQSLLPELSEEEQAALETSLLEEGVREALVVWDGENILLDGHNRLAIAQKHGLPYRIEAYTFETRDDARRWMLDNQLGRRNLTPEAFAYLLGLRYNSEKRTVGRPDKLCQSGTIIGKSTREAIAETHDVAPRTVARAGRFAEQIAQLEDLVGPQVRRAVLAREAPIRRADVERLASIAKTDPEAAKQAVTAVLAGEAKHVRDALHRQAQAAVEAQAHTMPSPPTITFSHWRDWLPQQPECDLLLTDPPYSTDIDDILTFAHEWLPVALAKVKPTGRAYVFVGAYPDELLAYLSAEHAGMTLRQVLVWEYTNTLGACPAQAYKLNWQAILYFTGADAPPLDCPLTSEHVAVHKVNAPGGFGTDMPRYHAWEKPIEIGERFVRHATTEGALVLDPFAGTGTFLLGATRMGREARGCDIDTAMLDIAQRRGCVLV